MSLRLALPFFLVLIFGFFVDANAQQVQLFFDAPLVESVRSQVGIASGADSVVQVEVGGQPIPFTVENGAARFYVILSGRAKAKITLGSGKVVASEITPIPLWLSIVPPLIAIVLALVFREVITALFIGILSGTFMIYFFQGAGVFASLFKGALSVVDTYAIKALNDPSHLSIIVFSMLIGGMVALITLNGGMKGVVALLSKHATNRKSGQMITFLMGIFIFFDDYANTLVVGNTMRPLTDKLKISREKLAYLVDSTSAPVAAIAFVTTWIGAELSYIESGLVHTQIHESSYQVFISSLQYSFYPLLTIVFVAFVILMNRDFGSMLEAERKAIHLGSDHEEHLNQKSIAEGFEALPNAKPLWGNALLPVLVLIVGTLSGLIYTGISNVGQAQSEHSLLMRLSSIIGNADTYKALLWASLLSVATAVLLSVCQRIMNLGQAINGIVNGFKAMFSAIVILVMAWCIAQVTEQLQTATFITQLFSQGNLSPYWIPGATFVLSALVSFSTGTSWGTMAIIYPLVLPVAWKVSTDYGLEFSVTEMLFHQTVSAVLAGAVFGDHVSPISDTTILSSLASSCNHIRHVRTQMPYALVVGGVSLIVGIFPSSLGVPVWVSFISAIVILYVLVKAIGKTV